MKLARRVNVILEEPSSKALRQPGRVFTAGQVHAGGCSLSGDKTHPGWAIVLDGSTVVRQIQLVFAIVLDGPAVVHRIQLVGLCGAGQRGLVGCSGGHAPRRRPVAHGCWPACALAAPRFAPMSVLPRPLKPQSLLPTAEAVHLEGNAPGPARDRRCGAACLSAVVRGAACLSAVVLPEAALADASAPMEASAKFFSSDSGALSTISRAYERAQHETRSGVGRAVGGAREDPPGRARHQDAARRQPCSTSSPRRCRRTCASRGSLPAPQSAPSPSASSPRSSPRWRA